MQKLRKLIIAIVVLLFIFVGDGYSNTLLVDEEGVLPPEI